MSKGLTWQYSIKDQIKKQSIGHQSYLTYKNMNIAKYKSSKNTLKNFDFINHKKAYSYSSGVTNLSPMFVIIRPITIVR